MTQCTKILMMISSNDWINDGKAWTKLKMEGLKNPLAIEGMAQKFIYCVRDLDTLF